MQIEILKREPEAAKFERDGQVRHYFKQWATLTVDGLPTSFEFSTDEPLPPGPAVLSPKLEGTTGAVIIRRGDTLWQISRRVYGHGVRYSTIYLANQDQIEDPDLIWPGQIFAVPQQTDKGEAANMKALAGQATEMPKKAVE